jgi:biofilm PGA synthesis protein PgaD
MTQLHEVNINGLVLPDFIYRSDLQSFMQKSTSTLLAAIGWMIWAYLFVPLLSLIAWWLGYRRFDQYVIQNDHEFFKQIYTILPLVMVLGIIFLLWAFYNLLRFRGKERRGQTPNVTVSEVAHFFEIEAQLLEDAQTCQVSTYYFDESGRIIDINLKNISH